jgi:hypothetical protein
VESVLLSKGVCDEELHVEPFHCPHQKSNGFYMAIGTIHPAQRSQAQLM